jgi:hypothetical protein
LNLLYINKKITQKSGYLGKNEHRRRAKKGLGKHGLG